jgi:hypothetical protein
VDFQSPQERILHDLSLRIIGEQALFCPQHYGLPAKLKEPADIAWVTNRCAILIYATSSGSSFQKKRKHNCGQLHKWLRAWRSGHPLRGEVAGKEISFGFDDIDYVVGLSIIENGEVWCEYHADEVRHSSDFKLAACATLPMSVMHFLAQITAGPKDLIFWLSRLLDLKKPISDDEFLKLTSNEITTAVTRMRNNIGRLQNDTISFQFIVENMMNSFSTLKRGDVSESASPVLSDLGLLDLLWFTFMGAALLSQLAPPGQRGPLFVLAKNRTGVYQLQLAASANLKVTGENVSNLGKGEQGITIILSMLGDAVIPITLIHSRKGLSNLEIDLQTIRAATLCQSREVEF